MAQKLPGPIALTTSLLVSKDEWVLDSGCTFHITQRRELLTEFKEFEGNKVMMGNNTHCKVRGMGKITIDNGGWNRCNIERCEIHPRDGEKPDLVRPARKLMLHLYREGLSCGVLQRC